SFEVERLVHVRGVDVVVAHRAMLLVHETLLHATRVARGHRSLQIVECMRCASHDVELRFDRASRIVSVVVRGAAASEQCGEGSEADRQAAHHSLLIEGNRGRSGTITSEALPGGRLPFSVPRRAVAPANGTALP